MAYRVTAAEVLEIMDDVTLSDPIVEAYIVGANTLVSDVLSTQGLSATTLKEIERWLSAHMIASTRERQATEEGAGGAYIKYAGSFGEQLKSTPYGQMVLTLDSSGLMHNLELKSATLRAVPRIS